MTGPDLPSWRVYDHIVRVKFSVAPGQDARMTAMERLGQVSRQLAGQVAEDGLALCDPDFEIAYVDLVGTASSRELARGGTAWLKARTRRQAVECSDVLPAQDLFFPDSLMEELGVAVPDGTFRDFRPTDEPVKE
ncbi:hypothetical protein ACIBEJ_30420 [Nonomuraea sp. NPDC050790]|uniref:hypothetical protein n=1 Tax=Nonomuraea sp. NPDC050790 TaxID=3364371 RepID=UPI0037A863B8